MASICLPGVFCNLNKWYEHSLSMCHLNRNKCKEAIQFLQENPQWKLEKRYMNNNGLTILKNEKQYKNGN